jgi:3-hydroxybutyrate dehydrogenase
VAQEDSVKACTRAAIEAFGGIDILINSAGIAPSAPLHKMPLEDWNRVLAVNLTGPFLLTKELLPGMLERKWGRVIHVVSIAGKSGMQYVSAYCASKHGLMGMIRATALEVAPKGVTINGICPGYVESPMTDDNVARIAERTGHSPESVRGKMESFSPQRRLIEADEVAASAVYLAGESARGINGQGINICGGSVFS